ncbi:hypothetical protein [Adhaeribacter rhizoryzae]|uniref:Uncharacterized protein n=1 Tax=Adhaeribacter rhizoryzae TaxID=2607907 RepID=A0A5M6D261_9BACT|nr:hypothetical protein [Adhaeribacter rhizoryzae]KAA5540382.1 hypothetical protein F0145_23015 [Adhaeribacter rhizoryzae]
MEGKKESACIAQTQPRPVIKVFHNILADTLQHIGKLTREEVRIAILVAGDKEEHKKVAAQLPVACSITQFFYQV